jgi:hypothetical protein
LSIEPFELDRTTLRGVALVFTARPAGIAGTVVSGSGGGRDPSAAVVVFPADLPREPDVGASPRLLRCVRVDRTGSFHVSGLPAGAYLVAAVPEATTGAWQSAAFLTSLTRVATRIDVADGATSRVALRTLNPDAR